jgi:hypothetical protein
MLGAKRGVGDMEGVITEVQGWIIIALLVVSIFVQWLSSRR